MTGCILTAYRVGRLNFQTVLLVIRGNRPRMGDLGALVYGYIMRTAPEVMDDVGALFRKYPTETSSKNVSGQRTKPKNYDKWYVMKAYQME